MTLINTSVISILFDQVKLERNYYIFHSFMLFWILRKKMYVLHAEEGMVRKEEKS